MNVQMLKVAGKKFVLLPERDFRRLQNRLSELDELERGDVAESKRRKAEGPRRPYSELRKRLGLA